MAISETSWTRGRHSQRRRLGRGPSGLESRSRPAAAAVVFVESVDDVVVVVGFARDHSLHQLAGPLADTILLKTSRLRGVEINPETRTARVEAGVLFFPFERATEIWPPAATSTLRTARSRLSLCTRRTRTAGRSG